MLERPRLYLPDPVFNATPYPFHTRLKLEAVPGFRNWA
jgi:hypothetical protein